MLSRIRLHVTVRMRDRDSLLYFCGMYSFITAYRAISIHQANFALVGSIMEELVSSQLTSHKQVCCRAKIRQPCVTAILFSRLSAAAREQTSFLATVGVHIGNESVWTRPATGSDNSGSEGGVEHLQNLRAKDTWWEQQWWELPLSVQPWWELPWWKQP